MSYGANTESSGGTRYSQGKPGGWWYAPLHGLKLIAPVWEAGAAKYAPMDWKSGQSFSTLFDCMMRHLVEVQQHGIWSRDPDLGTYHLANACWNLLCLLTFMALGRHDLDDITPFEGVTAAQFHGAQVQADIVGAPVHQVLASQKIVEAERNEHTHLDQETVHALNTVSVDMVVNGLENYTPNGENAAVEGEEW